MSPYESQTPETQDVAEALWRRQQRLLSALRSGADTRPDDSDDDRYRDVFAALHRESLPTLPDDFAVRVAVDAQRLADARAQVWRFRTMLASLLSLLYLPAMLGVVLLYRSEWLRSLHSPSGSWSWVAILIALAMLPATLDRLIRRSGAGTAGD
jgi:hypothetical protein